MRKEHLIILICLIFVNSLLAQPTPTATPFPSNTPTIIVNIVNEVILTPIATVVYIDSLTPVPTPPIRPFSKEQLDDFKAKGIPTPSNPANPYKIDIKNKKILYDITIKAKIDISNSEKLGEK